MLEALLIDDGDADADDGYSSLPAFARPNGADSDATPTERPPSCADELGGGALGACAWAFAASLPRRVRNARERALIAGTS